MNIPNSLYQAAPERTAVEQALRESEETYRALVEGLPDIVMRFDRAGRHLFVSNNVNDSVDYHATEFIGKTHREMGFSEEQCRFWEEAIQGVFDSGAPFETEFIIDGKQGPVIYNWRLMPERDTEGNVRSVFSLSRDITAHRRAEQDFGMLFREMLDGFALHEIIYDETGKAIDYRFLNINPAFERMTGLKSENLVGRTILEVMPGTEPYWIETYGKVALTGEPIFFENYSAEVNKHFEVTAFRPGPKQFACIFADITERKRTEEVLSFLARSSSGTVDEPFFESLARYLAQSLGMDFVCIDRLDGDGLTAQTVAVWCDGKFEDNVTYALKDTPCGDVVGKTVCCFPASVCQFFPRDQVLQELRAESYVGVTLWSHTGQPIGLIAIIGRTVLANRALAEATLKIVAVRAAAELERLDAEKKLQESEDRFKNIFEQAPLGIALVDSLTGGIYELNSMFARIVGRTVEEMASIDWMSITHSDHVQDDLEKMALLNAGKISGFQIEERCFRPDGAEVWINMTIAPAAVGNKAQPCHLCMIEDITERKRAEAEVRSSRDYIANIINAIGDPIFVKDEQHRFVLVNDAECALVGRARAEIIGKTDADFFPQGQVEVFWDMDHQVLSTGQESINEEEIVNGSTGETRTCVTRKTRHVSLSGNRFVVGVIRDITEGKRREMEHEKLEGQLRQAQKMEAIGTLAGGIAHDFNNILQSILVYAELAQQDVPNESPVQSEIKEILTGAKRARDLVARILAFSRQTEEERMPLKLQPIIKESLELLRGSLPSTIDIRQDISDSCGFILGDPTRVRQVIMNLCTNAHHAMRETGGVLEVRLQEIRVDEEMAQTCSDLYAGAYVLLSVLDTGRGIEENNLKRIFDPYFTTKKVGEGSGLGLSVVHGIVKEFNGTVRVESTVGHGSRFDVYLPVYTIRFTPPDQPAQKKVPVLSGTERILVVDDEEAIARSMSQSLRRFGYEVDACASSLEARDRIWNDPKRYDVVITDQTMPRLTGMQLARDLLSMYPELPIILCTGYSDLVDECKSKAAGIRAFLTKPFQPEVLAQAIRHVLDAGTKGAQ